MFFKMNGQLGNLIYSICTTLSHFVKFRRNVNAAAG